MITQSINLNLVPGGVLPRINVSQYDKGTRTLEFTLYNGSVLFSIPDDVTITIQGTKADSTGFQYECIFEDSVVTSDLSEQMTVFAGEVVCELVLTQGTNILGTANFILNVEAAALSDDTVISDTDLPLLQKAIEAAAEAATSAEEAANNASAAEESSEDSEAYAIGTRGGTDVTSDDPAYHNNAKYYAESVAETIENLDVSDTAVAGAYVTAVSETDGKISVTREAADTTPTSESKKMVTSGGVYTALESKQDTLTFDTTPTSGSSNPVTSGGVYTELAIFLESGLTYHNIPRNVPKDITSYVSDGSLWYRLNGTGGYSLYEDIFVGDYIQMSRAISAYEQTQAYQTTGSKYVTIAGIDWYMQNGDTALTAHHLVMVPGQGFGGTQHFGRSRMNSSNSTSGGYVGSEMFTTTLGAVASSGSTASTATINQQLYAEFGSHLQTTRELLSNAMDSARYNRFGQASGATSGWAWTSCQAVLMSEIEVYGSIVFSSAGQDTGTACRQLPLFAHSKLAQNNRTAWYWLKDVASAAYFCNCSDSGSANYDNASRADYYVRPRFILA